jgi:hypothetical protein
MGIFIAALFIIPETKIMEVSSICEWINKVGKFKKLNAT